MCAYITAKCNAVLLKLVEDVEWELDESVYYESGYYLEYPDGIPDEIRSQDKARMFKREHLSPGFEIPEGQRHILKPLIPFWWESSPRY